MNSHLFLSLGLFFSDLHEKAFKRFKTVKRNIKEAKKKQIQEEEQDKVEDFLDEDVKKFISHLNDQKDKEISKKKKEIELNKLIPKSTAKTKEGVANEESKLENDKGEGFQNHYSFSSFFSAFQSKSLLIQQFIEPSGLYLSPLMPKAK